jgi:heme exporter protein CcmD
MDLAAAHAGFVVGAYALSALLLAGTALYVLVRDRRLSGEAARLEGRRKAASP